MTRKRFLIRALGITILKTLAYTVISLLVIQFIAANIPLRMHQFVMTIIFFLVTFLFGEWIFGAARVSNRMAVTVIVVTYLMDVFVNILIWSPLLDVNFFFSQLLTNHLILFPLYAVAMVGALYDRKRLGFIQKGPIEGLVN